VRPRPVRLAALIIILALALGAACSRGRSNTPLPNTIVIGYSNTATGPEAATCRGISDGYALWADAVNRAGGLAVGSRRIPVQLVGYDDGGNAVQAARNAERLILRDNATFLLGACLPALDDAVATVAAQYNRLLVLTQPFADATLTRRYTVLAATAPTAARLAALAVSYLTQQQPPPRAALLWADDQPAKRLGNDVVNAARDAHLDLDALGAYPAGAGDLSAQAARIKDSGASVAIVAGQGREIAALLQALQAAQALVRQIVAMPEEDWNDIRSTLAGANTTMLVVAPWAGPDADSADPLFGSVAAFREMFAQRTGNPPTARATLAVAGAEMLSSAVAATHTLDAARLASWLASPPAAETVAGAGRLGAVLQLQNGALQLLSTASAGPQQRK
jgi:branched-chain amino acid transport system substrate-binding protein